MLGAQPHDLSPEDLDALKKKKQNVMWPQVAGMGALGTKKLVFDEK